MITSIWNTILELYAWKTTLSIVTLIGIILMLEWRKRKLSKLLSAFPRLRSYPIIGSLHYITGDMAERVNKVLNYMKIYETPIIFWVSYKPVIVLTKIEHIQTVMSKTYDRDVLGIFKNILQDGILLAQGERWRSTRRLMNPAFSPSMLQKYITVFNEQSSILAKRLGQLANTGQVIDLWQYVSDMNLDTVTENVSDYQMHVQENGGSEFSIAVVKALELESMRFSYPLLLPNFIFNIYKFFSGNKDLYKKVNNLPTEIVRAKLKEHELQKQNPLAEEKPAKSLIDLMLKIHDTNPDFTEDRMRIEILNMIFAGSDTTTITASSTLLLLAIHPDAQQKVYEEIIEVTGNENRNLQMEDFCKLKYMEQCVKETLRRFSLVPITARKIPEPIKLNDQQVIPSHHLVVLGYHAVHNDPQIFPDPDRWDPDRFNPENNVDKNAFMGFGVGNRACIGSKYAMMSIKTQLVHILRQYQLTSEQKVENVQLIVDILARSQNGYPVKIWRRDNNNEIGIKH